MIVIKNKIYNEFSYNSLNYILLKELNNEFNNDKIVN